MKHHILVCAAAFLTAAFIFVNVFNVSCSTTGDVQLFKETIDVSKIQFQHGSCLLKIADGQSFYTFLKYEDANGLEIEFVLNAFTIVKRGCSYKVEIPNAYYSLSEGYPVVPTVLARFVLAPYEDLKSIDIVPEITSSIRLSNFAPLVYTPSLFGKPIEVDKKPLPAKYPDKTVYLRGPDRLRDANKLVTLTIAPLSYFDATKTAVLYTHIKIIVEKTVQTVQTPAEDDKSFESSFAPLPRGSENGIVLADSKCWVAATPLAQWLGYRLIKVDSEATQAYANEILESTHYKYVVFAGDINIDLQNPNIKTVTLPSETAVNDFAAWQRFSDGYKTEDTLAKYYKAKVLNPAKAFATAEKFSKASYQHVVLYDTAHQTAAANLAAFRNAVTYDATGLSTASIKTYLQDCVTNHNTQFVSLVGVGNSGAVGAWLTPDPMGDPDGGYYYDGSTLITDFFYEELDLTHVPSATESYAPDLFVGRPIARSSQATNEYVDVVRNFERGLLPGAYKDKLLAAAWKDSYIDGERVESWLITNVWSHIFSNVIYLQTSTGTFVKSNVLSNLRNGVQYFDFLTHGEPSRIIDGASNSIQYSDIAGLDLTSHPTFVYAESCLTGRIFYYADSGDYPGDIGTSFAAAWLDAGALGYQGGTGLEYASYTGDDNGDLFHKMFAQNLHNHPDWSMGEVHAWTRKDFHDSSIYGSGTADDQNIRKKTLVEMLLLADPELHLFPVATPVVTLHAPNGGERYDVNTLCTIRWYAENGTLPYTIDIYLSTNGGNTYPYSILNNYQQTTVGLGTYQWLVTNTPSTTCKIKVVVADANGRRSEDETDGLFTIIQPPVINLQLPNGGEGIYVGDTVGIRWDITGGTPSYRIEIYFSTDSGTTFRKIATVQQSTEGIGVHQWQVPDKPSQNCRLKLNITDAHSLTAEDVSAADFTIARPPGLKIVQPSAGDYVYRNDYNEVVWTVQEGIPPYTVDLALSTDAGVNYQKFGTYTQHTAGSATYRWFVTDTPSANCNLKLTATDKNNRKCENTSGLFSIVDLPTVAINSVPASLYAADVTELEWTIQNGVPPYNVEIDLSVDNGITYQYRVFQTTQLQSTNTTFWHVPYTKSAACRLRFKVTDANHRICATESNVFSITLLPVVNLGGPSENSYVYEKDSYEIYWFISEGIPPYNVSLTLSTNNGTTFDYIIYRGTQSTEGTGYYAWTAPSVHSSQCVLKITATDFNFKSNATFGKTFHLIKLPKITVLSPNGGETFFSNSYKKIEWQLEYGVAPFDLTIYYSTQPNIFTKIVTLPGAGYTPNSYSWQVPSISTDKALVKISVSDVNSRTATDVSDAYFKITFPSADTATVYGMVKDYQSRKCIANVQVEVYSYGTVAGSCLTDADGNYKLTGLPAGNYEIKASKEGYIPASKSVWLKSGETHKVDFTLYKTGTPLSKVHGIVVVKGTAEVIANVTITVPKIDVTIYTDANGYFEFKAPYDNYTIKFEKEGFKSFEKEIVVSDTDFDLGKIELERIAESIDITKWFAENLLLFVVLIIIIIGLCIGVLAARSAKAKKAAEMERALFQYPTDTQMLRRYLWKYDESSWTFPPSPPPQPPSEKEVPIGLEKFQEQRVLQHYIGGGEIKSCPLCNKPNPQTADKCYSCGATIW